MNIKRIIREEMEGFKDSTEDDWAWVNDIPDITDLKHLVDYVNRTSLPIATVYYFPYITEEEFDNYVLPSIEYWYPNFRNVKSGDNGRFDHTEIKVEDPMRGAPSDVISAMVHHFGVSTLLDMMHELNPNNREGFYNGRELFKIPSNDITNRIAEYYDEQYDIEQH